MIIDNKITTTSTDSVPKFNNTHRFSEEADLRSKKTFDEMTPALPNHVQFCALMPPAMDCTYSCIIHVIKMQ